jgi:hypothetical protein
MINSKLATFPVKRSMGEESSMNRPQNRLKADPDMKSLDMFLEETEERIQLLPRDLGNAAEFNPDDDSYLREVLQDWKAMGWPTSSVKKHRETSLRCKDNGKG